MRIKLLCLIMLALHMSVPLSAFAGDGKKLTTLRPSDPKGTFVTKKGGTKLTFVEVPVRNAGDEEAEDIQVSVITPSGNKVELSGPSSLAGGKVGSYSASVDEAVTSMKKLKAVASCGNCR